MYYHTQDIKYVCYGKIYPPPINTIDQYFLKPYLWLGKYCAYCPQVWLSRSKSQITGYKNIPKQKNIKCYCNKEPSVMFSFEIIKGFPVDYDTWCYIMSPLMSCKNPIKDGDNAIEKDLNEILHDYENGNYVDKLDIDDPLWKWKNSKNINDFLNKYLFIENDQVVVPSLNLKSAKEVFCRNEKQVKMLRRMGFIKDRIKILNSKQRV